MAKYWLPVCIWGIVIYSASGDSKSVQRSSRLIEPLVRWLFPDASDEMVHTAVFLGRKCAHLTEYAIFAWLIWWARRNTIQAKPRGWSQREAWIALVGVAFFAATDELHQGFVPGRQASVWDVLIDSTGAAGGLFLLWLLGRWRKWW